MFAGQLNKTLFNNIIFNKKVQTKEEIKMFNEISPLNSFWHAPKEDETFQTFCLLLIGFIIILVIVLI